VPERSATERNGEQWGNRTGSGNYARSLMERNGVKLSATKRNDHQEARPLRTRFNEIYQ